MLPGRRRRPSSSSWASAAWRTGWQNPGFVGTATFYKTSPYFLAQSIAWHPTWVSAYPAGYLFYRDDFGHRERPTTGQGLIFLSSIYILYPGGVSAVAWR